MRPSEAGDAAKRADARAKLTSTPNWVGKSSRPQDFWENHSQKLGRDTTRNRLNPIILKHLPIIQ